MKATDLIGLPRDSKREREAADELRRLPEEEAFDLVFDVIEQDYKVGLELAQRCLRNPAHFETILNRGMEIGDASTVKYWLRSCLPRLGPKRLLRSLLELAKERPEDVEKAVYWLQNLLSKDDREVQRLIGQLREGLGHDV